MDNFTPIATVKKKKKVNKFLIIGNLLLVVIIAFAGYFYYNKILVTTEQKAETGQISGTDNCNKVRIEVGESPSCNRLYSVGNQSCPAPAGTVNNVSSYTTVFRVNSNDGQQHQISWKTANEFCSNACGNYTSAFGGIYGCSDSATAIYQVKTETVNPGQQLDIVVTRSSPSGQACGTYQQDLWIDSIDGNAQCNFKSADNNVGAWSFCQTGVACSNCQQMYYCDKSDVNNYHCVQTNAPQGYEPTSPYNQCGASNPPTCASNLGTVLPGKTTGVCYPSQNNCDTQCAGPTSIPTSTPIPPTSTPIPTSTLVPTITPSNTPTATPVISNTPTATPLVSNTPTATPVISNTPTMTPVISNTPGPSATPTEIVLAKTGASPTTVAKLLQTGVVKSFMYFIPAIIMLIGLIL